MRHSRLSLGWLPIVILGLVGCGVGPVASDSAPVDPEGWSSMDTIKLGFEVNQPEHRHDLQLGLRHNADYPFSNLYLFVRLTYPNGRTLTDTLSCPLAAPDGQWYGQGSRWIDHRVGYKKGVAFPLSGSYELEVVHAMRTDPLPGVSDIRFALFDLNLE